MPDSNGQALTTMSPNSKPPQKANGSEVDELDELTGRSVSSPTQIVSSTTSKQERKQFLPDYGLLYFDNLYGEYRGLPPTNVGPEEKKEIATMLEKKQRASLTWDDLYTFDLMLTKVQSLEKLRRKVWSLRSRYRDVAGPREYEVYLESKPPDPEGTDNEKDLRADVEHLLSQLYMRYALMPVRERERKRLATWVVGCAVIGLLMIYLFVGLTKPSECPESGDQTKCQKGTSQITKVLGIQIYPNTFAAVLFVGAMGGLISLQQRFQSVPDEGDLLDEVSQMRYGTYNIWLSPISGAVFAGVLYLIIVAGILEGTLFPAMGTSSINGGSNSFSLADFLWKFGPKEGSDYAKLLMWAFLAGFAERFVPDTLSRFVERGKTESGTKP